MKLTSYLTVVSLLVTSCLVAQPTMTRDWFGRIGEEVNTTFSVEVPEPGPAGADQTWDFSGITPDTLSLSFKYVDPSGTPSAALYPMSNLCLAQETFGIYGYLSIDEEKLENYGSAFLISETIYTDPETELVFPLSFEDTFEDDYSSSSSQFGVTTYTTGSISGEADGYGSVILPNGTFEDAIRVKIVDESVDSTDLGLGIVEKIISTTTTYFWYSAVHPGPLCIQDQTEGIQVAIVEGLPNDTIAIDSENSFSFDITATTSSNEFFQTDAFELKASPNPFADQLNLTFGSDRTGQLEFELRNNLGQLVIQRSINAVAGQNTLDIETGTLTPGTYVAILKNEEQGSVIRILKAE